MKYGYARVSTDGQSVAAQVAALNAARARKVFREVASGAKTDRSQLRRAIATLGAGNVLMMTRLDRLARSTAPIATIRGMIGSHRSSGHKWRSSHSLKARPSVRSDDAPSPIRRTSTFTEGMSRKRRDDAVPSVRGHRLACLHRDAQPGGLPVHPVSVATISARPDPIRFANATRAHQSSTNRPVGRSAPSSAPTLGSQTASSRPVGRSAGFVGLSSATRGYPVGRSGL
jgi:hypothetical protein